MEFEMTQPDPAAIFHRKGWLAAQPEPFRRAWLEVGELRTVPRGIHLYSLGDPPGGIYGLAEGFADVLVASGYQSPFLGHIARPGWWVGEAAAVTGSPRRVEIRARTEMQVCYVSLQDIEELESRFPRLWRSLAQMTVTHLDNALMLASCLVKGDARTKIAGTLIRLAGSDMREDADISVPCSQQELGEMAGLSRNSAGPALRGLERDRLIARETYGWISFNPVRLADKMESDLDRGAR
ncbi:Crp/Fnr family transcriptional regulator [Sedimentitalea sp. JM2-8]|uniref:Crp/Fnr family transcriptional regulator n=1 Tax=Sedimentitalea xiamensis TaxID=3050037 RepID=A0ABT7FIC0_9RHOB|nr:Crp/Fnr family transcriptional regulator [Sedimentitalea xiamensis]MDK3074688.1 Crp/Fnr family transcriptional regulator [Sedimentitalea xiamensis]